MSGPVLGIDPGTRKCGYALVAAHREVPLAQGIVPTADLDGIVRDLRERYGPRAVALGGGTNAARVALALEASGLPVHLVDERATTLLARHRYFLAHPPRGWRRLVPRGMLLPPRSIDDFAAVLIAERFLEAESAQPPA